MCKKSVLSVLILIRNSAGHLEGLLTEAMSFGAFDVKSILSCYFHLWRGNYPGSNTSSMSEVFPGEHFEKVRSVEKKSKENG